MAELVEVFVLVLDYKDDNGPIVQGVHRTMEGAKAGAQEYSDMYILDPDEETDPLIWRDGEDGSIADEPWDETMIYMIVAKPLED